VATLPGTAFGPMGKGFLRLSYGKDIPHLEEGIKRIGEYLTARQR
jgi:aspartate/methionine/tyrosine aminotransferase